MDMEQFKKFEKAILDLQEDVNDLKEVVTDLSTQITDSLRLTEAEMRGINYKLKELKTKGS